MKRGKEGGTGREFDWLRCSIGTAGAADTHLSSTRNGNENSMTAQPKSTPTTIFHAHPLLHATASPSLLVHKPPVYRMSPTSAFQIDYIDAAANAALMGPP